MSGKASIFTRARSAVSKAALQRMRLTQQIRWGKPLTGAPAADGRYVTYLCDGGMCNRLKSHLVARLYAKRHGRSLLIRWPMNGQCGARFEDLFEWRGEATGHLRDQQLIEFPDINTPAADLPMNDVPAALAVFDLSWQWITRDQFSDLLGDDADDARAAIRPQPAIAARVADVVDGWPRPIVGVHVRRGDFATMPGWTIDLDNYITAMKQVRDEHGKDLPFFLASDADDAELAPILSAFGKDAIFREPASSRETVDGVSSALVTMLLLSHTDRLILTPRSSFGETAAFLGGQPYTYA